MNYKVFRKAVIEETLHTPAQDGVRLLEPLKSLSAADVVPLNILEEKQKSGESEVHRAHHDLWQCLEGEAVFVCGGILHNAIARQNSDGSPNGNELTGDAIDGGEEITLKPGDWLWIPSGIPHQHRATETVRMIIIKIPK